MRRAFELPLAVLRGFWCGLRQWCGDADYERYLRALRKRNAARITREQFYLEQLERRYSRPNRCC